MGAPWVTLPEVRTYLRFPDGYSADDDELQTFIDGACAAIEDIKGPVSQTTIVDEPARVERGLIFTSLHPVISIASLTFYRASEAIVMPEADPTTNTPGWSLRSTGGVISVPLWGFQGLDARVSYVVGRNPVPANYDLAAKELTGHLWRTSQLNAGGGRGGVGEPDQEWIRGSSGSSYALPFKVRELLGIFGTVVRSQINVR